MAHHRKLVVGALAVNTAIVLVEAGAGFWAGSLSLVMDALHNLSDELALLLLWFAYAASRDLSQNLLRAANLFNTAGLIAMSLLVIVQAAIELRDPQPVPGWVPALVGFGAAAANGLVAWLLRGPARDHPSARLAYLHNLGDAGVSLAPAVAGVLILVFGESFIDPLVALLVGLWILGGTLREMGRSHAELIWPGRIECGPAGHRH